MKRALLAGADRLPNDALSTQGVNAVTQGEIAGSDTMGAAELIGAAAQALGGAVDLLIWAAPTLPADNLRDIARDAWEDRINAALRSPVDLLQAFAAQTPHADHATGEPTASALAVLLLDHRRLHPTAQALTGQIAQAGLVTLVGAAALELAPDIRVNAIVHNPDDHSDRAQQDLQAALAYLVEVESISGQVLPLGHKTGPAPENITLASRFSLL